MEKEEDGVKRSRGKQGKNMEEEWEEDRSSQEKGVSGFTDLSCICFAIPLLLYTPIKMIMDNIVSFEYQGKKMDGKEGVQGKKKWKKPTKVRMSGCPLSLSSNSVTTASHLHLCMVGAH